MKKLLIILIICFLVTPVLAEEVSSTKKALVYRQEMEKAFNLYSRIMMDGTIIFEDNAEEFYLEAVNKIRDSIDGLERIDENGAINYVITVEKLRTALNIMRDLYKSERINFSENGQSDFLKASRSATNALYLLVKKINLK